MLLIKALFIIVENEKSLNYGNTLHDFAITEHHAALKIDDIEVYALTWKDVHYIF